VGTERDEQQTKPGSLRFLWTKLTQACWLQSQKIYGCSTLWTKISKKVYAVVTQSFRAMLRVRH